MIKFNTKKRQTLQKRQLFERMILPHLEAAYNLARWLTSSTSDAEDIVQESYLKAFKSFDTYLDQNSKAWLLAIVRNTSYTWMTKHNKLKMLINAAEDVGIDEYVSTDHNLSSGFLEPEEWLIIQKDVSRLYQVINQLPLIYKEIIILREIEGCDYRELSEILNIAPGTVMSRLSRARNLLQKIFVVERSNRQLEGQE